MNKVIAENEKTLVSKFVENFNKLKDDANKQALVKKHVVTHYAPILHKMNVLNIMVDGCVKQGKAGKYIDMIQSKMTFISAILVLYTDLNVDKVTTSEGKEVPDVWTAYDQLKESGALDMILNEIGSDLEELISVQDQVLGTWHNENASVSAFLSDLVEKVSMIFSAGLGKELGSLTDMLATGSDEDKANLLATLKENFKLK